MMKRNQVMVRAKDETGQYGPADVMDLDEESARAFAFDALFRAGLVVGIKSEFVAGENIPYKTKPGYRFKE